MYIARILYPINVLGPGNRIGVWTVGCRHRCQGCSNPELWNNDEKYSVTLSRIEYLIRRIARDNKIDGFTITGGEPLEQAEDMEKLLESVEDVSTDVLMYTGYKYCELTSETHKKLLSRVSVLIDGRYQEDLNNGIFLRGSSNQNIIILKDEYADKYSKYIAENHNEIQNFMINNEVISVGIHKKHFKL